MIFKSELVEAQWDTWCYFHEGTYYLYYLITEDSPGGGFGVATSADGVNWTDHGYAIRPSEKMENFLGTGSVWPDPKNKGRFLCNYSEWHMDESGKRRQCILFAWSDDLIHWNKFEDEHIFWIDEKYYERYGRWDCIFAVPRPQGGYYGTWTATPAGSDNLKGGIGFGVSDDGLKWEALPPAKVVPDADESGATINIDGKIYTMFGVFVQKDRAGMHAYVADSFEGPYRLAKKSSWLLQMDHAYFSRYFETPDGVLVNHHVMDGRKNDKNRAITYLAPFKKLSIDAEGIQRWMWWPGNDKLKNQSISPEQPGDFQRGVVIEGTLEPIKNKEYAELSLDIDGDCFAVRLTIDGKIEVLRNDPKAKTQVQLQSINRDMEQTSQSNFRLLARRGMIEFYLDDYFMTCCKLDCPEAQNIRCSFHENTSASSGEILQTWQMKL